MADSDAGFSCSPGIALRVIIPSTTSMRFEILFPGGHLDGLLTKAIRQFVDLAGGDAFAKNQQQNLFVTCVPAPHERGRQFIVTLGSNKHVSPFVNRTPLVLKLRNCIVSELLSFMTQQPHGPDGEILSSICVTVAVEHFRLYHLTHA